MLSTELIKQKNALYSHVEQSDMREAGFVAKRVALKA